MNLFAQALHEAAPYLEHYGYVAIFIAIALEGIGVPAPGVTFLVAGALAAGQGKMSLPIVAVVGFFAALIGFNSGYWLGAIGGTSLLRHLRFIKGKQIVRMRKRFNRWGIAIIFIAPFIDGLRQVNGYVAGIAHMPWKKYLLTNLSAVTVWIALWSSLGYEAGIHTQLIYALAYRLAYFGNHRWWYLLAILGLAVIGGGFLWYRHKRGK